MTLRLSETELKAIQERHAGLRKVEAKQHANLIPGVKPRAKGMNKWEAAFAQTLAYRKSVGELIWWAFEPFRIRLADDVFYRPDFVTVDKDGRTEIYEVKGHFREAARVRLRVAAEKLPYPFYIVKRTKGEMRITPL